jgi:hypothetical protein
VILPESVPLENKIFGWYILILNEIMLETKATQASFAHYQQPEIQIC